MLGLRGFIVLAFFLPSLPICLFRPFYGILIWTVLAFTSLHLYAWGAADYIPLALAVALATLIGLFAFNSGTLGGMVNREGLLLIVLWAWFMVTSVVALNTPLFVHHTLDTMNHIVLVSKIFLITLVTMCIVNSFERLRILIMVIAGCFGLFVLKALPFLIATGAGDRVYGPDKSMIADNNDFGLALNMTLPIYFFLAQSESRPWVKRLCWFLVFATVPTILFTYSRGALVGLIAVLGLMCLSLKQRTVVIPIVIAAAAIAMLFAPEAWRERMDPTKKDAIDTSAQGRLDAWRFALALASDYPITGGGFGAFTPELFRR